MKDYSRLTKDQAFIEKRRLQAKVGKLRSKIARLEEISPEWPPGTGHP